MTNRLYTLLILTVVFSLALILTVLSFVLLPFQGDLTRLGGHPEQNFLWKTDQQGFDFIGTNYALPDQVTAQIDTPYYAIRGDSFSHWCKGMSIPVDQTASSVIGCIQWTAHVKDMTGLDGLTFHHDGMSFDEIISELKKQERKPEFFLYEIGERGAVPNLHQQVKEFDCQNNGSKTSLGSIEIDAQNSPLISSVNNPVTEPWNFDTPVALIRQTYKRLKRDSYVLDTQLTSKALFSNKESDTLLYYSEDVDKRAYSQAHYDALVCGMRAVQQKLSEELDIPVVFMIVPDKSSVYAPWFANQEDYIESLIPKLPLTDDLYTVDLLSPMRSAVESGTKDVYLPNDTHWGTVGHRIAAESLVERLKQNNKLLQAQ